MRASEQFRIYLNSPITLVTKFFFHSSLRDIPEKELNEYIKEIKSGKTPSKKVPEYWDKEEYPWFRPEDIGFDIYLEDSSAKMSNIAVKEKQATIYPEGTLLVTGIGDIGRVGILIKEASSNQQIMGILFNEKMLPEYGYFSLMAMNNHLYEKSSSTTLPILNQKNLSAIRLKAPRIEVQTEFVKFQKYLFNCLKNGELPSKTDFNLDENLLKFSIKAFSVYFSKNELVSLHFESRAHIQNLRQAILQEAVSGKLVPQDPKDEPASELLKKIKAEKKKLIEKNVFNEERGLQTISTSEIRQGIPDSWIFVRLNEICSLITDGTHQTPNYTEEGRPFLSAQNVKPFRFMLQNHRWVSEMDYQNYIRNKKPELNDVLLTRVGAGIGEAAVIDKRIDFAFYVSLALIKTFNQYIDPNYLCIWLNSPTGREKSGSNTYGVGHSQGNLNLALINNFVISLPPFNEQKRIVEKVNRLMKLCDRLEEEAEETRKISESLMETVLGETFAS